MDSRVPINSSTAYRLVMFSFFQVLAKKKGLDWKEVRRLGDLQTMLKASLTEMMSLVKETFHEQPYTKQEICDLLEVSPEELNQISLSERTYSRKSFSYN